MHRLVRWLGGRGVRWFYRDVVIVGRERIPSTGPVLLVGNHPNDLPDVLIGYHATPRPVRYVANAAAATSVAVRWTYEGLGVIPVMRVRDARKLRERGVDMTAANEAAMERIRGAFRDHAIVGVFPEGGVHEGPDIGPLRSGVAKMVLERFDDGSNKSVVIVPIGVQYEHASAPRSAVVARIGEPLRLSDWLATPRERPSAELTAELRRMLRSVSRTAASHTEGLIRDRLIAAVSATRIVAEHAGAGDDAERRMRIGLEANDHWTALLAHADAASAAELLGHRTRQIGGDPSSSHDHWALITSCDPMSVNGAHREVLRRAIVGAPLGIPGGLLHAPLLATVWWLAGKVSETPSDRAARSIVPGLYLVILWYLALATLAGWLLHRVGAPWWIAPVIIPALPPLGDAGVRWRDCLATLRLVRRARALPESERAEVRDAAARLRRVWTELFNESAVSISA